MSPQAQIIDIKKQLSVNTVISISILHVSIRSLLTLLFSKRTNPKRLIGHHTSNLQYYLPTSWPSVEHLLAT